MGKQLRNNLKLTQRKDFVWCFAEPGNARVHHRVGLVANEIAESERNVPDVGLNAEQQAVYVGGGQFAVALEVVVRTQRLLNRLFKFIIKNIE
jgi:hypothetical protein